MKIEDLKEMIGGHITSLFNYNVCSNNSFKALALPMDSISTEVVRISRCNGFDLSVFNYTSMAGDVTEPVVFVYQRDHSQLQFI